MCARGETRTHVFTADGDDPTAVSSTNVHAAITLCHPEEDAYFSPDGDDLRRHLPHQRHRLLHTVALDAQDFIDSFAPPLSHARSSSLRWSLHWIFILPPTGGGAPTPSPREYPRPHPYFLGSSFSRNGSLQDLSRCSAAGHSSLIDLGLISFSCSALLWNDRTHISTSLFCTATPVWAISPQSWMGFLQMYVETKLELSIHLPICNY